MEQLQYLAEQAGRIAAEYPEATAATAYIAADAARLGVSRKLGKFKSRFDYDGELMTQKDVEDDINELEDKLGSESTAMEYLNRYVHPFLAGKEAGFKSIRQELEEDREPSIPDISTELETVQSEDPNYAAMPADD